MLLNPYRFGASGMTPRPPSDTHWASVVLCLDEDTIADGSTTFTDKSASGLSPTVNGNIQWDTAVLINGRPTILTDGTGDYLRYASTSAFGFGTGDFTTEGAFNFWQDVGGDEQLFDFRASGSTNGMMYRRGANLLSYYNGADVGNAGTVPATGLSFLSWSRVSGVLYGHIDGINVFSAAMTGDFTAARALSLFANFAGTASPRVNANMIRITKGVGRYNGSNYTVPLAYAHNT